jgi:hypothetical protein
MVTELTWDTAANLTPTYSRRLAARLGTHVFRKSSAVKARGTLRTKSGTSLSLAQAGSAVRGGSLARGGSAPPSTPPPAPPVARRAGPRGHRIRRRACIAKGQRRVSVPNDAREHDLSQTFRRHD